MKTINSKTGNLGWRIGLFMDDNGFYVNEYSTIINSQEMSAGFLGWFSFFFPGNDADNDVTFFSDDDIFSILN